MPVELVWDFRIRVPGRPGPVLGGARVRPRLAPPAAGGRRPHPGPGARRSRGVSAGAVESIASVGAAVSYLRVVTDEAGGGPWLGCQDLLDDPDALLDVVRGTKDGIGTDRDDVAMSLFVQGWVFRVASLSIGAWLLDDVVLDVAPSRLAVAIARSRPNAGAGPRPAAGRGGTRRRVTWAPSPVRRRWRPPRASRAARRRPPGAARGGGPPGVPGRRAAALVATPARRARRRSAPSPPRSWTAGARSATAPRRSSPPPAPSCDVGPGRAGRRPLGLGAQRAAVSGTAPHRVHVRGLLVLDAGGGAPALRAMAAEAA